MIDALAISGSTLYVGGSFNTIGGQPRNNIAALSLGVPLDGVAVPGFNPSPSKSGCAACGTVAALAVSGSTVYAGGLFDTIGGQARNNLAGLNAADGVATAFNFRMHLAANVKSSACVRSCEKLRGEREFTKRSRRGFDPGEINAS